MEGGRGKKEEDKSYFFEFLQYNKAYFV